MLEVARLAAVAIERNGGAGKIESAAVCRSHDFNSIWITDIFRRAKGLQSSHLNGRIFHDIQQSGNLFGTHERFVALHVEVNIGGNVV